jgi:phosphate uptake regulator
LIKKYIEYIVLLIFVTLLKIKNYLVNAYDGFNVSQGKPPKSEIRKVQLTGGSTYIVSLPKKWVNEHGLVAKDQVRIEWRPSGTLRIVPEATSLVRKRVVELDLSKIPDEMVHDHLVGSYLAGSQVIKIKSQKGFERNHRKTFRKFINSTRGVEISAESESSIEMINLLNPSEMPLYSSLNRMYLLISSQIRDVIDVLSGGDKEILEDCHDREQEVDAIRLLLERQVGQILESASIEDSLGTSRWEASGIGKVVRTLERMGDHSYALCKLTLDRSSDSPLSMDSMPMSSTQVWQSSIKLLISNLRRRKISEIHSAKGQLLGTLKDLENFEIALITSDLDSSEALFFYRISESLRRMCAYSINMGEELLNIQSHRDSIEITE